jgi:hypothetical protein
MRASTDATLASWPLRIFRPWLVATVSGLALGKLLLSVSPQNAWEEFDYLESMPRAAVYDARDDGAAGSDASPAATSLIVTLEELGDASASEVPDTNILLPVVERYNEQQSAP